MTVYDKSRQDFRQDNIIQFNHLWLKLSLERKRAWKHVCTVGGQIFEAGDLWMLQNL